MSDNQSLFPELDLSPKRVVKSRPRYAWEPGGTPPRLGKHSIAKHDVLSAYLRKYVSVLAGRLEQEQLNLTLVDGFSGGGTYLHPDSGETIFGSPILMLNAMKEAEAVEQLRRKKSFRINAEYFFIDKDPFASACLNNAIAEISIPDNHRDSISVLTGRFSDHLQNVIERVEKRGTSRRVIFVLDQYGYSDVKLSDVRKIFQRLPNAEVILTLAIDWLVDFISDHENTRQILSNMDLDAELLLRIKEENPSTWREKIQLLLSKQFFALSGAACYTPFFIHSVESHRAYWLLHFSGHSKARDVMTALHWELENHFQHFGGSGFGMLGFDPRRTTVQSLRTIPFDFDLSAKAETREALLAEIPRRVAALSDAVPFGTFFDRYVNDTPATKQMFEECIQILSKDGEIKVRNATGKSRRPGVKLADEDVLVIPKQKIFFARSAMP